MNGFCWKRQPNGLSATLIAAAAAYCTPPKLTTAGEHSGNGAELSRIGAFTK
jgi:hypothetical protein